jgi:hypothetical protein
MKQQELSKQSEAGMAVERITAALLLVICIVAAVFV